MLVIKKQPADLKTCSRLISTLPMLSAVRAGGPRGSDYRRLASDTQAPAFRRAVPVQLRVRTMLCASLTVLLVSCGGGASTDGAQPQTSTSATANSTNALAPTGTTTTTGLATTTPIAATSATTTPTATTPATTTPTATTAPAGTAVAPYGQDASLYTLGFQDEFDGTALNSAKWTDHIWYDAPSSTNDYGVSGGSLKIWPQRNAAGQFAERILVTEKKYYQTYGYFEMEAKLSVGAGTWPAFWLLNDDSPDTGSPEIDIMEAYSGDTTGYWADGNKHPTRYGATFFQNGANQAGLSTSVGVPTVDLSAGFHKYAVKWEPNKLTFYFDGVQVATSAVTMSRRMYILLDMQYGSASGAADSTTPTGSSNSFEVNYVRAWTFK